MKSLLLIGPPDASLDTATAILGAHPRVAPLPAGRLLTALAHVGIEANIDKAAYDHILAAPAQRLFLEGVEGGIGAWHAACRAYFDSLLAAADEAAGADYLLDTAPEYARLWPFIERVLPDAAPILLVRNPVATAAEVLSTAEDPRVTRQLLLTWRHLAALVRARGGDAEAIRYEILLRAPEAELSFLENTLGKDWPLGGAEVAALDAAADREQEWPRELARNPALLARVRALLERIPGAELQTLGHPWAKAWAPVEAAGGKSIAPRPVRLYWHGLVRRVTDRAAAFTAARPGVAAKVRRLKLACDVLLRE